MNTQQQINIELNEANRKIVGLRDVLRSIEWVDSPHPDDLTMESHCPACHDTQRRGHRNNRQLAAALKDP